MLIYVGHKLSSFSKQQPPLPPTSFRVDYNIPCSHYSGTLLHKSHRIAGCRSRKSEQFVLSEARESKRVLKPYRTWVTAEKPLPCVCMEAVFCLQHSAVKRSYFPWGSPVRSPCLTGRFRLIRFLSIPDCFLSQPIMPTFPLILSVVIVPFQRKMKMESGNNKKALHTLHTPTSETDVKTE